MYVMVAAWRMASWRRVFLCDAVARRQNKRKWRMAWRAGVGALVRNNGVAYIIVVSQRINNSMAAWRYGVGVAKYGVAHAALFARARA